MKKKKNAGKPVQAMSIICKHSGRNKEKTKTKYIKWPFRKRKKKSLVAQLCKSTRVELKEVEFESTHAKI